MTAIFDAGPPDSIVVEGPSHKLKGFQSTWIIATIWAALSTLAAPSARATTVFATLDGAGPGSFAVLGLDNTSVILSNVVVNGTVGISADGTLTIMAPSTVNGDVYEDPQATVTGPGHVTGSTITQSMGALVTHATDASSQAALLAPDQTFSSVTATTTITGNGGTTVIHISGDINLNNANLNLNGGASDYFIVNVGGNLSLVGTASLNVTGTPVSHVLFNFTKVACTLNTHVGDVLNGIILADNCGVSNLDGTFNGEIIYGGNSVSLLSGALVNQAAVTATPEPSSLLLFGSGCALLGAGLVRRQRKDVSAC